LRGTLNPFSLRQGGDDEAVLAPGRATIEGRIRKSNGRPTLNGDLFQFPPRAESDPLPVGREEDFFYALGSG